ncbi:MAG TPA: hypothetical protein VN838_06785 [Bradyrhizobium sp.]|nr:hypothetical protein [Bradyrhizobium sp.]
MTNNSPSLISLLDEALLTADKKQIDDIVATIAAHLAKDDPARKANRDKLAGVYVLWRDKRPKIENEEQATKAGVFVGNLKDAIKSEEAEREPAKKPFLEGGRLVDKAFKDRAAELAPPLEGMLSRIQVWQSEQRAAAEKAAKIAAEEARKKEAAAREAAAAGAKDEAAKAAAEEAIAVAARAEEHARTAGQVRTGSGGAISQRHLERVRLKAGKKLNDVPADFLLLNEKAALAAVRAKDPAALAVFETYQEEGMQIR